MYIGVHVSIAGNIAEALDRAKALRCNAMQIFSRNPRQWRQLELSSQDIEEFKQRRKKYKIEKVVVHIPYLINLASPYKTLYRNSIKAYIEDLKEADNIGAEFLVTHMGSHADTSELAGIDRFASALNTIFDKTKGIKTKLLLENTSGSGSWLGYKFIHHRMIYNRVKQSERLGICLDTAHAFTAGYDLKSEIGLNSMLSEIDELVGVNQIEVIHFNDSKKDFSSHLDQHENIGKGKIGFLALQRIIKHPKLKNSVFILETPKVEKDDDKMNLSIVKKMAK
ncbi:MAG: deoxyribonuclease IV [Candidatus Omnitrophica bacterium]|nr:deoxyribonuclease IV [Candidatus Omnitrophota bacterium]MDD5351737.1 deoxyribonuclease IV [Candidatus Omnitrophota bacterium]MDD5550948.1 deoxyribonuclease IV [Candidatus Omnitrophota bacterium]